MLNSIKYFYTFETRVRQRWLKRPLLEVLETEYKSKGPNYFKNAIKCGAVRVNNKKTTCEQRLIQTDIVQHTVHVHEPKPLKITIIADETDYIVVDKPSGIACHPTGNYNFFTVTKSLEKKYGKLSCINRLDVPTSGVLILARQNSNTYHKLMENRNIKKIYLAKVKGKLNDQVVDKKLKLIPGKNNVVHENGKKAITRFRNICYVDGYSLVECKPETGRTHQIRVHLQSIGFPIVNDILYGGEITHEKINYKNIECDGTQNVVLNGTSEIDEIFSGEDLSKETIDFVVKNCEVENNNPFKNKDLEICLHAYKYYLEDKIYTAPIPKWAMEYSEFINKKNT